MKQVLATCFERLLIGHSYDEQRPVIYGSMGTGKYEGLSCCGQCGI
nr:hypothetical protein [Candidatus Electrothrix aestuarii]